MPIPSATILTWSRIALNRTATVTNELIPGGLTDLKDYSVEDIREAIKGFKTLPRAADRFHLSAHSSKRIVQLALWVKDRARLVQPVEFEDNTTLDEFVSAIEEAQQREKIRQERKKNTEGLATMKIDPPLKSSAGWDTWTIAIRAALTVAYGSKGIPLLYVIRDTDAPQFIGGVSWEELAISAAPHAGLDYEADRKTVHLFLLNNISEDSDAQAYIQPLILRNDGRRDWIALNDRYENTATIQARVNQANKTWEMLVYKNERAMSFEAFCKKLTKALQYFTQAGRPKHDGDVIDWIWSHIQNGELSQFLSALKVGQSFQVRTSREILQEIAKEIPNLSKGPSFQPRISEIHQTDDFTLDGEAPATGVHTTDGKLYCGTYSPDRWFSDEIKPFREQIMGIRKKHGKGGGGGRSNSRNKAKRKLQQLEKTNEELQRNLSALQKSTTDDDKEKNDNAGDAFGGKSSMHKK
jgi:hypothetical protein